MELSYIPRILEDRLRTRLNEKPAKVQVVLGPRQVGKTTLIRKVLEGRSFAYWDADDRATREVLNAVEYERFRVLLDGVDLVFLDEAQRVDQLGLALKMLADRFPQVRVLVSGSSALEINQRMGEFLTGRKRVELLLGISWLEWCRAAGVLAAESSLEDRLVYGMYPEVLVYPGQAEEQLNELASGALYHDLLALTGIRRADQLERLVRALALQVGSEVNYNELSRLLGIDKGTVARYLDLLEKTFVVFTVPSYSKNERKELKNSRKVYFFDNGIRNAVLGNFLPLEQRADVGALWENFLFSERRKALHYAGKTVKQFFWRTTDQQEVDYLELQDGDLAAFEFKWRPGKAVKTPPQFEKNYNKAVERIDRTNYNRFLTV